MIVDCAHYRDGARQENGTFELERAAARARRGPTGEFVWVDVRDPGEAELAGVGRLFGLHELALEDARQEHARPKIEAYDADSFLALRTATIADEGGDLDLGEVHAFVSAHYVVAIGRGELGRISTARDRAEARPALLASGPPVAIWAIVDAVVDDYDPALTLLEDEVEAVEREVFARAAQPPTERIYRLGKQVFELRRAVAPLLPAIDQLEAGALGGEDLELRRYFRDVADNARRAAERIEAQHQMLTGVLEANLALVGLAQAEVVKRISAWAAIIAVPTFVASVYGMNVTGIPAVDLSYGFWIAAAIMVAVVIGLRFGFRRAGWL